MGPSGGARRRPAGLVPQIARVLVLVVFWAGSAALALTSFVVLFALPDFVLLVPVLGLLSPMSTAMLAWGAAVVLAAIAVGFSALRRRRVHPAAFLLQAALPAVVLAALLAPGAVEIAAHGLDAAVAGTEYTLLEPAGSRGCRVVTAESNSLGGSSGTVFVVDAAGLGIPRSTYGAKAGILPAQVGRYRVSWAGGQATLSFHDPQQAVTPSDLVVTCADGP